MRAANGVTREAGIQQRRVMTASGELLSIVIPMFNAGACITATLDSVARQKDVAVEVIVVDDVSTDDSVQKVLEWHERRPQLPLRVIRQERRGHTLRARLAGVRAANGPDIMFVDADDRLLGEHTLGRILGIKRQGGFDIAHFRTQSQYDYYAEAYWTAPISERPLHGPEIFSTYAGMYFPPVLVWGKIYSAALLREVAPLAEQVRIFRLEDVFLSSLLMLFARSYCPVDEYAYLYEFSENWATEKFAGRVHDLHVMRPVLGALLEERGVAPEAGQNFMAFLERRLAFNMNGLCRTITDELEREIPPAELRARLAPYLGGVPLISLLCPVLAQTRAKAGRVAQRIGDGTKGA